MDLAFRSQIQRASVSICANIAEGSGRRKGKDQGQFYKIAYSSAIEILNHLLLCINNEIITDEKKIVTKEDFNGEKVLKVSFGKKQHVLIEAI